MYHLNQFPLKIAEVETKILNLEREVNIYKEQLSFMDADIENAVRRSQAQRALRLAQISSREVHSFLVIAKIEAVA